MCKHQMKKIRDSAILHRGKIVYIEVYQCKICKKFMILDSTKSIKVSLNDKLGEEIE